MYISNNRATKIHEVKTNSPKIRKRKIYNTVREFNASLSVINKTSTKQKKKTKDIGNMNTIN